MYKNAKEVYSLSAGDKPVDMTNGFTIGGGRTHATFDEVRVYKTVLKQGEINGLFYLVSKGTQVKQLEKNCTIGYP
ncbi:LamG domain-containing protein [Treponema vincentii]|uniref:LamG domain-containing protein n=1 Tax=Treponema vincentii TaxID=69710 RepID=A0A6P1Y110_9SPIR|nr:LamG domain-containing protein [Treponema vincentii]QHX42903.1 LamG domain-containing protein [Treponema vincentii]